MYNPCIRLNIRLWKTREVFTFAERDESQSAQMIIINSYCSSKITFGYVEEDEEKSNHSIRVHPSSSNAYMSLAFTVSSNL